MTENVNAITDHEIDVLVTNLQDSILNVKKSLDDMSFEIYETKAYFQGEAGDKIRSTFSKIESNFKTIIENLSLYKDDFIKVKNNYIDFSSSINTSDVEKSNLKGDDLSGVNKNES